MFRRFVATRRFVAPSLILPGGRTLLPDCAAGVSSHGNPDPNTTPQNRGAITTRAIMKLSMSGHTAHATKYVSEDELKKVSDGNKIGRAHV